MNKDNQYYVTKLFVTGAVLFVLAACGGQPTEDEDLFQDPDGDEIIAEITLNGIADETIPQTSVFWNWGCSGAPTGCEYRYVINNNPTHTFGSEPFGLAASDNVLFGDGTFYIHIQARDTQFPEVITEVLSFSAILDNTAPAAPSGLALSSPATSPSFDPTPSIDISGVSDRDQVELFSDSGCSSSLGSAQSSGSSVVVTSSSLADGIHTFYARTTDQAGNSSPCSTANVSYLLDTVAPSLAITSAADITTANVNSYVVVGSCSEEGVQVSVQVGSVVANPTCSSGTFSSGSMNVSTVADNASLPVSATQVDVAGNSNTVFVNVNKDTVSSFVAITSAPDISSLNETSYFLSGTCSQNGVSVDLAIGTINKTTSCASGVWNLGPVDVSALADGPSINVTADHSTATQASTTIAKDTASPTVAINSHPNIGLNNQSNYQVSGSCSVNGQNVTIDIGGIGVVVSCSSGAWSSGPQIASGLTDGSITITADHSTATQAVRVVTKNTSTPSVINLSSPSTLSNSVNLSWSVVDPGGFTLNDYHIQYRVFGSPTWLPYTDGVSLSTSATVDTLSGSTSYEFRVRLQYDTSSYSDWSTPVHATTKPENPLFDSPYKAMNVGGATTSNVVAYYDDTYVTLNGVTIPESPLSKGQVVNLTTAQYDVIDADKPIYTAGRRGSGGNTSKANVTWSPTSWAGTSFSFNAIRDNSQELYVYATEDAELEVRQGSNVLAAVTITSGNSANLSWSTYGSYQVISTGTVLAYHISTRNGTRLVDPKPLLPSSNEIIGFPSNSMRLTTDWDATNYNFLHSNSTATSGSLNKQDVVSVTGQGSPRDRYKGDSLLVTADRKVAGSSYADSDGNCAAPFLPTNLMKRKFVINANAQWVAFASKQSGTIEVYSPTQTIGVDTPVQTLNLTNSGGNPNAPFNARFDAMSAGYRFVVDVPAAVWYEPSTDTGAANDDETILYGTDD